MFVSIGYLLYFAIWFSRLAFEKSEIKWLSLTKWSGWKMGWGSQVSQPTLCGGFQVSYWIWLGLGWLQLIASLASSPTFSPMHRCFDFAQQPMRSITTHITVPPPLLPWMTGQGALSGHHLLCNGRWAPYNDSWRITWTMQTLCNLTAALCVTGH